MLLPFLYELRQRGVPLGVQEWMALMEALARGLHESSLTGFYQLSRALLVHSESYFDAFDQAFAHCFSHVEQDATQLSEEVLRWLDDPAQLRYLSAEERKALEQLDLERLREQLAERLQQQRARHQGGNRWIGSGGTSAFGRGGYHPTGVRIGDVGGGGSAAQVAALRRYRGYRNDVVLDVRQIRVALRRLRQLRREGERRELDLEQTVQCTSRNAGDLELCWRPPRRNNVKLLLLMDVGGSMDPHAHVVSQLFSAAHQSKQFRDFHAFYFHNCVYEHVYRDAHFREGLPLSELLASYGPNYKLVLVGDALMHPLELFSPTGALSFWQYNEEPGLHWLTRLTRHYERSVWLNPETPSMWRHPTVEAIASLFPMFPLTLDGLDDAIHALTSGQKREVGFQAQRH
jgi:uncharacterized protein with von Willebrand factor type A (vWA) domain